MLSEPLMLVDTLMLAALTSTVQSHASSVSADVPMLAGLVGDICCRRSKLVVSSTVLAS